MTTLPKKYTAWTNFWFYEYIQKKKSLVELSKEFEIPITTIHAIFRKRGLPLRNLKIARKVRKQKLKENANNK